MIRQPFIHLRFILVAAFLTLSPLFGQTYEEKAEQAFRKTVALAPNDPVGYRELARFYLRTNTNVAQAYGLAQKSITLEKNAEAYYLLGWAADVNGDRASALKAMEQAIKLEPNNQQYRNIYERIRARK